MTIFDLRVPRVFVCLLALLACCLVSKPASADTIIYNINDLTDTITATKTINGGTPTPVTLTIHGTEEVGFIVTGLFQDTTINSYVDLTEVGPGGGPLSDRISFKYSANVGLVVSFCSDPSDFSWCLATKALSSIQENGTPQQVYSLTVSGNTTIFQVQSDVTEVGEVPEPASLILMGSGLSLVGALGRRFRK